MPCLSYNEIETMQNLLIKDTANNVFQKDAFSTFFEQNKKHADRKEHAQFFTHKSLVKYILDKLHISQNSSVLDPSSGAGAFLSQAKNFTNRVYGIDIEEEAANLCRQNLGHECTNIIVKDTLKDFDLKGDFPEIYKEGGFDFVIGNPPFQNLKKDIDYDSKNKVYKAVANGVVNSATLMIAKSIELLKEGGYLAFVLPKNILRVATFANLRKFLLENTSIISITDIGHFFKDVRGDQMVMVIQKKIPEYDHRIQIEILNKTYSFDKLKKYQIFQSKYKEYDIYPLFYDSGLFRIYEQLKKHDKTLEEICNGNIFRGVSVDLKKHLYEEKVNLNMTKVYRGASIERFGTKKDFYISNEIANNEKFNRMKQNKIILQNLCSKEGGIFATISNENELNIDTVTNVIPTECNCKYILGILNSKIANIFVIYLTFLHSNFTMHTDKTYIGKLPIVIPNKKQEQMVVNFVDKLLLIKDKYSKEFFEIYNQLNDLLFEIYGFDNDDKKLINNILKEGMSKRQNG